ENVLLAVIVRVPPAQPAAVTVAVLEVTAVMLAVLTGSEAPVMAKLSSWSVPSRTQLPARLCVYTRRPPLLSGGLSATMIGLPSGLMAIWLVLGKLPKMSRLEGQFGSVPVPRMLTAWPALWLRPEPM